MKDDRLRSRGTDRLAPLQVFGSMSIWLMRNRLGLPIEETRGETGRGLATILRGGFAVNRG